MTNKTVVFVLNTPFALLAAIQYYEKYLCGTYSPLWVFMSPDEDRFNKIDGIDNLPGKVYHYKDMLDSWAPRIDTSFLVRLASIKVDMVVLQNLDRIANIYLLSKFKRHNHIKVILISDGLSLSVRASPKRRMISNVRLNYRRILSLMGGLPIFFPDSKRIIKQIDSYFAAGEIGGCEGNYRRIDDLLHNAGGEGLVESVFRFNFTDNYDVYFFTQPISSQRIISNDSKRRYELLLESLSRWSIQYKKKTLVKVHPSEKVQDYIKYKNEFCDVYMGESIPAELFFIYVAGKKVISCFSSVSITDVQKRNSHYWCYPAIGYELPIGNAFDGISILDDFQSVEREIYIES